MPKANFYCIGHREFHEGVVGIVASRMVEELNRPVVIYRIDENGSCKGSGRSIPGFSLFEALREVNAQDPQALKTFGGHAMACGLSFSLEKAEAIQGIFDSIAGRAFEREPELLITSADYDCEIPTDLLTLETIDLINTLKPFGNGFPAPLFRVRARVLGKGHYFQKDSSGARTDIPAHTYFDIQGPQGSLRVNFFNRVIAENPEDIDLLLSISADVFRGRTRVSLTGLDLCL